MKAEIKSLFLKYLAAYNGVWNDEAHWVMTTCDVCRYSGDMTATKNWIKDADGHHGFSSMCPDLCYEHALELGVAW